MKKEKIINILTIVLVIVFIAFIAFVLKSDHFIAEQMRENIRNAIRDTDKGWW